MSASARPGRVIVVGSANLDLTVTVDTLPRPGQTMIARDLSRRCGGKGANQAAAAARLRAQVRLVAAVGDDDARHAVFAAATAAGVETDHLHTIPGTPTGTAVICVDAAGENAIVVVPGANAALNPEQVERALADVGPADIVLVSLEIETIAAWTALRVGRERGATTMLNPSPYSPAVAGLLSQVDVVLVNEGEAAEIGADAPDRADLAVIVTLGGDGVRVRPAGSTAWHRIPAPVVEVIDTTGCGDAFAGAVASELATGTDLVTASGIAVRYAALAATAPGAQSSYVDRVTFEAMSVP